MYDNNETPSSQEAYEQMWSDHITSGTFNSSNNNNNNKDINKKYKVFVYGSLMKGMPNHYLLKSELVVNSFAVTKLKYKMLNLGQFPALCKYSKQKAPLLPSELARFRSVYARVMGEVYEVSFSTLRNLDRLERNGKLYERELIELANGEKAWCYILTESAANSLSEQAPICYLNEDGKYCWFYNKEVEFERMYR